MTRRFTISAAAIALVLGIASCGEEEDSAPEPSGLASLVPAGAPVYVEAIVRPDEGRREEVEQALSSLLGTDDPGAMIVEAIDRELESEGTTIRWEDGIEPWLGERAALFFESFGREGEQEQGAFLVETDDPETALATVEKGVVESGGEFEGRSYEGVEYEFDAGADPTAIAVLDDTLVVGSEDGLRSVIDAAGGGESLGDSDDFLASVDTEALVSVYADPEASIDAAVASGALPAAQREAISGSLGFAPDRPVVASVDADADAFSAEFSFGAGAYDLSSGDLLGALPADSWLAFGVGDYGEALERTIDAIDAQIAAGPAIPELGGRGIEAAFERETGLDLREDVARWVGDVAFYARGASIFDLNLAVVVEATDRAAPRRALDALRGALEGEAGIEVADLEGAEGFEVRVPGEPVQIPVVQADGRVIAGLGQGSIEEALEPEEPLEGSDALARATDALGEGWEPFLLFDMEPVIELVESTGDENVGPDYEEALPYLEAIDLFTAGVREGDGRTGVRFVLGVD